MDKSALQFRIDSLRKDKIIYGIESCAINVLCLFLFFITNTYVVGQMRMVFQTLLVLAAVGYTAYMGIGNFFRLQKIKELEVKL